MFELKISEIDGDENNLQNRMSLFRKVIESAADIVDDVDVKINDNGVYIQFMDAMNVAMMDVYLSKATFDLFRCDRSLILGLKIKEFLKILKGVRPETVKSFYLHCDDNPNVLSIMFEGNTFVSKYEIKLQNGGNESYEVPKIDFVIKAEMKCSELLNMKKAVGGFSEYIQIKADKDSIRFSQKGEIIDSKMMFKASGISNLAVCSNENDAIMVEIPMKYINCITKTAGFCPSVKINMGCKTPVFFEFGIYDYGHIKYYVAPKVDDE